MVSHIQDLMKYLLGLQNVFGHQSTCPEHLVVLSSQHPLHCPDLIRNRVFPKVLVDLRESMTEEITHNKI